MQVWSNILNLAYINAMFFHKQANKSYISRQNFLIMLIEDININHLNQHVQKDSNIIQRTARILEITPRISASQSSTITK